MGAEGLVQDLEILVLAPPPPALFEAAVRGLSRRVAVPCRVAVAPEGLVVPRLAHRNQVDADALLRRLEALPRPGDRWTLALTTEDLGNPIFTFFFGRARHHGGAALVSVARLLPAFYGMPEDEALTVRRIVREALHELGHLGGLEHCQDNACVMRFAATVEAIDNRGDTYCSDCAASLPDALVPSFA